MGKIFEQKITRFDGGILDDIREESSTGFQISTHFDNYTNPLRLTPYRNSEANETKSQKVIRFIATNSLFYGYGVASGNDRPAIYFKASNVITDAWTAPTDNAASSGGDRNTNAFWVYKDFIYGFSGTTVLWNWGDLTATPVFDETHNTTFTAFTNVVGGITHPADDICYFATDNLIHKIASQDGTATKSALVLPDNLIITDLEPWGNYLAIACKPKDAGNKSIVFLWDRDSSLTTISDKIDWGEGDLLYIANLDGRLVGVTDYFLNNSVLKADGGKLIIKIASNDKARTIKEIQQTTDDTTTFIPNTTSSRVKIVKDNKLFFPVAASDQAETFRGAAVVDSRGRITMDFVEEEASSIEGMFLLGNFWFFAHSNDGSVNRTANSASFTHTSIYQSQKYTLGDASKTKKLIGATVMSAPLPTAGQVVLRYRKDEETTWTTIFTNTTDNSISHSAINIESSGATLVEFKEIQFRIQSTGGAEITGLKFRVEEIDKDFY